MTTRLAIVCNLDDHERWAEEYLTERGDGDDCQLFRQLVLTDYFTWLRKRMETTDEKPDNRISSTGQRVGRTNSRAT